MLRMQYLADTPAMCQALGRCYSCSRLMRGAARLQLDASLPSDLIRAVVKPRCTASIF